MVRWLSTLTIYAGCLAFLASPAAAKPVTGHTDDVVFGNVTIVSVGEGSVGESESSIGQVPGTPLLSEPFEFPSGVRVPFAISFEPGSFGGVVVFGIGKSDNVNMGTAAPFDALLVRTNALLPGTSIEVTDLTLGPAPTGGGGGSLIFETGSPGTRASSRAFGGGDDLDILKIAVGDGDPALSDGFTLQGQVLAIFDSADPQPSGDELLFQVYLVKASDIPDADGDGVPDSDDNCPNVSNPDQTNNDTDLLGDACDNCDFFDNPPGPDGTQADGDDDGAGDECDNCPVGCTKIDPPTGTCANSSQEDSDSDGVGNRCDNCPDDPNGPNLGTCLVGLAGMECTSNAECDVTPGDGFCSLNQENSDGDGDGDACLDSEIGASRDEGPLTATAPDEAGFSMSEVTTPAAPSGEVVFSTTLNCGSQNIADANIGFLLPAGATFVNFAGCDPAPDPPGADNEMHCLNATYIEDLGVLGDTIAKGTVGDVKSVTIGPGIADPDPTDGATVPSTLVILKLKGRLERGFAKPLLCEAFDPTDPTKQTVVPLGPLTVSNLPDDGTVLISNNGFDAFTPPLSLLVDPGDAVVPATAIETSVDSSGSDPLLVNMAVNPNFDDPGGKRFVVTMEVPGGESIQGMAFGLRGPAGIGADEMSFGACAGLGTAGTLSVNTCLANADLGPGVADSVLANPPETYTIDPNNGAGLPGTCTAGTCSAGRIGDGCAVDAECDGFFPEDTLMVAVRGRILDFDPSLNDGSAEVAIGVVTFDIDGDPPQAAPAVDYQSAKLMPGFEAGAIQVDGGTISPNQVGRVIGGDTDSDRDDDNRGDNLDNCPDWPNTEQLNRGAVGQAGTGIDLIGDLCQCGDSGGDGTVDNALDNTGGGAETEEDDVTQCQEALAGKSTGNAQEDAERAARCSVTGAEAPTIIDLIVMERELGLPGSAGTPIEQVCDQARE